MLFIRTASRDRSIYSSSQTFFFKLKLNASHIDNHFLNSSSEFGHGFRPARVD